MALPRFSEEILRLKSRRAAIFLAAAVAILAGGLAYHQYFLHAIKTDAADLLSSIRDFKTEQILFWRMDRLRDTESLIDSPVLSKVLDRLSSHPEDTGTRNLIAARLRSYLKYNQYCYAMLARPEGRIILSVGDFPKSLSPETTELVRKALRSGRPEMGDFYTAWNGRSHLEIAARASAAAGQLVLLLGIEPREYLYPLISRWPTPSASGETTLGRREGEDVVAINELRHMPGAPLSLRRPLSSEDLPEAMALRGKTGTFFGTDYRGRKVLASVGMVGDTGWAIVAKMDWPEIMEESGRASAMILIFTFFLVIAAGGLAYFQFRLQTERYSKTLTGIETEKEQYRLSFEALADNANDMILLADPEKRSLLMVNKKACETYGYTQAEMLKLRPEGLIPPEDIPRFNRRFRDIASGRGQVYEATHLRKNGERFPIEVSASGVVQGGRRLVYFICRDISERKAAQLRLERTQADLLKNLRLYSILASINRAAARIKDREELLRQICATATAAGGYELAWIGIPDEYTGKLLPAYWAGRGAGYVQGLTVKIKDSPAAEGPSGLAARTGEIAVCADIAADPRMEPWRQKAADSGLASSAAVPLMDSGSLRAVLSLYSSEKNFFSGDEQDLLSALKSDAELALDSISAEEKRKKAETALKRTAEYLSHMMETVPAVLFRLKRAGDRLIPDWVSGSLEEMTGYEAADLLRPGWFAEVTAPEDFQKAMRAASKVAPGVTISHEFHLRRRDGSLVCLHAQLKELQDGSGDIIGSWTDVTATKYGGRRCGEGEDGKDGGGAAGSAG
ncbi:MAG: PAS domain S-box protein [Elusimicrobia bacterium]|nr:PAS domain S-box protein [Elusimicrobiota bacterium]